MRQAPSHVLLAHWNTLAEEAKPSWKPHLKSLIYESQSCERFGLRMTPKKSLKRAIVHQESLGIFQLTVLSKTHLIIYVRPSLCQSHPFIFHTTGQWCAKSLICQHLRSRLAVAINDYLSCLGWETRLINYTCKPGLILNWIFRWMI